MLVCLLGQPLSHSLSPTIHNASFAAQKLGLHYFLCPVDKGRLHVPLDMIRDGQILGSNVTIPHKNNVIPFLDELSPAAAAVEAVNTISRIEKEGKVILRGDNTDVIGFLEGLLEHEAQLEKARVLVLGTGGSSRAVVYSLHSAFPQAAISVSSRSLEKARSFTDSFGKNLKPCVVNELSVADFDLIVNTTPLGMHPHLDACPVPEDWSFGSNQIVYDLIYNPAETLLLSKAKAGGAVAINGLEMLVQQAAASYQIWTGQNMDLDAAKRALAL